MKPLLFNLINQTILPFNDITMNIKAGDVFGIRFDNVPLRDYFMYVTGVTVTSFNKVTNTDIFRNGFLYRPAFNEYMKNFRNVEEESSVVKIDFELMRRES